ncbi:pupal cuticle protein 20 [Drosophila tropicalis]|uniref:pupal cuticle protein 20 n=1 Tax=Drosophila tropicalis TaxID=46794 RepID=UPI0035ABFF02
MFWHPIVLVLIAISAMVAAGRLPQRYLPASVPSNQYLAPQASQLRYHGVHSGGAQAGHGRPIGGGLQRQHYGQQQIPIVRSDYQSDANGNYNFGYDTGNGIHRDETGEFHGGWPHGSLGVRGSYSYTGDDGQQYTVNYKADKNGFHAEGAHLPTSPTVPHEHHHQAGRSGFGGTAGYHGAASSNVQVPSSRYLPPGYRQRRHY